MDPVVVEEKILKAIEADPSIVDLRNIAVVVQKGGLFHPAEVHLTGKVKEAHDRERVEEIVRKHIEAKMKLVNELKVR